MATNKKKQKPAPSKTKKPGTTYDASTNMWVYSDNPSTWDSGSSSSCDTGSSYSSYDSGSSSTDCSSF